MIRRAVVIGAGVFGTCTAIELRDRGWSVQVFDRPDAGAASRADARILRASHGAHDWFTRSAIRGIDGWRRLGRRTGCEFIEERGVLLFVSDGNRGDWERHGAASLRRLGVPVAELSSEATASRFPHVDPQGLAFAVWEPTAGVIRAQAALRALHGLLESLGSAVQQADCRPGPGDAVLVDATPLSADAVIWAVGAQAPELFPGRIPVRTARQDSYRLADDREADAEPAWLDTGAELYGIPGAADRAPRAVLDVEADPASDPGSCGMPERLNRYLSRRFPDLKRSVVRREACLYATTPDDMPVLGRLPGTATNWLIGGDGGIGLKHAPAWSTQLADALDGISSPSLRSAVDPPYPPKGKP